MRHAIRLIAAFCAGAVLSLVTCSHSAVLTDYYVHVLPQQRAGMLAWEDTRQWTSEWVAHRNGDLQWLDPNTKSSGSFEHMLVRNGYLMISGFDQFSADCRVAEIEDINSGQRFPLTCSGGHFYSPMILPRDPWRMRVWGVIAGGPRRFYWESDFYPGVQSFNPCWYQGATTADTIAQDDSWWTKEEGWVRATGSEPYDFAGNPVRPSVTKLYRITIAKGIGPWMIYDKRERANRCAYSTWEWSN